MRCWKCGREVFALSDDWERCQNCGSDPEPPRSPTKEDRQEAWQDTKGIGARPDARWSSIWRDQSSGVDPAVIPGTSTNLGETRPSWKFRCSGTL